MKNICVSKYVLIVAIALPLLLGAYGGYYFTNQHYVKKETKESAKNQENLICEARVQKGKTGDVKSEYFIFEQSAKQEDCERFIDYKNLSDDTESVWLGF